MDFDDVLAEVGSSQGFDPIWQISFVLFTQTKLWLYRIFAALVAVPATLLWALIFALITVVYVWILAPALRLFDLGVAVARRVRNKKITNIDCSLTIFEIHITQIYVNSSKQVLSINSYKSMSRITNFQLRPYSWQ